MKRTFLITAAIAFGVTTALIVVSIVLMATGMVKRSLFGGYTFAFEASQASKSLEDINHKERLVAALKFDKVQIVPAEYGRKILATVTNPESEDLSSELVSMNLILYQDGKVVKIYSPIETITIKANSSKDLIMDFIEKDVPTFDKCELFPKN